MKYLMLDTNIYIDMVVSRNKSYNVESYNTLNKLLDYGEIKLLIPNIVIREVFRHIDNEIDKVGQSVNEMKKKVKNLYWVNFDDQLEKFNSSLAPIKSNLNVLVEEFDRNKATYKSQYKERFNKLFHHENTIILEENPDIVFKATQRSIYKKRPFHYNTKDIEKDCLADAIIIESVINIDQLIKDMNKNDKIYFISRNPEDFSDENDKNSLHEDIRVSLQLNGMEDRVKYSTLFSKTLSDEFKDEIKSVGLTRELEVEAEKEYREELEELYFMEEDEKRESAGLISLSTDFEEKLSELEDVINLIEVIESIKEDISAKCDDYYDKYYSLEEDIENSDLEKLKTILDNNQLIKTLVNDLNDEDEIKDAIRGFITCMIADEEYASFGSDIECDDHFSINTSIIVFADTANNKYRLDITGDLDPRSDDSDDIHVYLYKNDTLIERGYINIYYGFIEFDDDGNVGDGAQDDISLNLDDIISKLLDIKEDIINNLNVKIAQLSELGQCFN